MRALSERQAAACETASRPVCRCRCGGVFHGAGRNDEIVTREFFEGLAPDDPHHIQSAEEIRERKRRRTAARRAAVQYLNSPMLFPDFDRESSS